jgi:cathepsin L
MTNDEFQQRFSLGKYSSTDAQRAKEQSQKLFSNNAAVSNSMMARHLEDISPLKFPDHVNWVALGGVTPVKNQGACGSCWAFSTTGALEGAKFIRTGELVALSEQNLLDCDHKDLGCGGGLMDNAFKFDEKTGGLCSEEDYPYEARQGQVCRTNCTDVPGTIVSTFYDVPPGKTKTLMAALAMQPISVAVQANQFVFQFYKTGVLTDDSCGKSGELDHGVLAAGYGTDSETGEPYFLVKNSWGDKWGENGYIRMSRKSKNEFGMCALLKMASYPEVE